MEKNSIIKANGLCKSYSTDGKFNHILVNIDLDIYEKDFTVVMGSSGSGKSTLLYMLSGMDKATSGEVYFDNQNITNLSEDEKALLRRDKVGFVFQNVFLLPNLTGLENILVMGYLAKKEERKKVIVKANELIESIGIEEFVNRMPSKLSGGERQRIAILRAIINDPKVIFADEPTGALNSFASSEVMDTFTKLNEQGQSIVLVTHELKAAVRGNRILYLKDGKIQDELDLGFYKKDEQSTRETRLKKWLDEMGW